MVVLRGEDIKMVTQNAKKGIYKRRKVGPKKFDKHTRSVWPERVVKRTRGKSEHLNRDLEQSLEFVHFPNWTIAIENFPGNLP